MNERMWCVFTHVFFDIFGFHCFVGAVRWVQVSKHQPVWRNRNEEKITNSACSSKATPSISECLQGKWFAFLAFKKRKEHPEHSSCFRNPLCLNFTVHCCNISKMQINIWQKWHILEFYELIIHLSVDGKTSAFGKNMKMLVCTKIQTSLLTWTHKNTSQMLQNKVIIQMWCLNLWVLRKTLTCCWQMKTAASIDFDTPRRLSWHFTGMNSPWCFPDDNVAVFSLVYSSKPLSWGL